MPLDMPYIQRRPELEGVAPKPTEQPERERLCRPDGDLHPSHLPRTQLLQYDPYEVASIDGFRLVRVEVGRGRAA